MCLARIMGLSWKQRIPKISPEQCTPLVLELLELCHQMLEEIQALKDEIARLKGNNPRPKIQPSRLEEPRSGSQKGEKKGKRPGSAKRRKTPELVIHDHKDVAPRNIPEGSIFKGYEHYTVQDLVIRPHNTRYRLERWETPEGKYLVGKPPQELSGGHYGPTLVCYILYQYYHGYVTQPLLLEQLWEFGVDISSGQINRLLTEGKERYHAEKDEILRVGLEVSRYVHVDDTKARHQGRNGYCTHIGNELFAYFESTESKSRINFLQLLRGRHTDYVLTQEALSYMREHKLPQAQVQKLVEFEGRRFEDEAQWKALLEAVGLSGKHHVRIATEGALLGSVLEHGVSPELAIISDDAGQFNVFRHGLCWIHAERTLSKLVGYTEEQREALEAVRSEVWELYDELKAYKAEPSKEEKKRLQSRFDELFTQKTCYASLNLALERLYKNKNGLLLVLDRPEVGLQNNLSERDVRDYVKRRKISGSTRSDEGRRCRDTFTSVKKTCRKLGLSFWKYLLDRVCGHGLVPSLGVLIRQQARASPV